jgi:hypothetical protein
MLWAGLAVVVALGRPGGAEDVLGNEPLSAGGKWRRGALLLALFGTLTLGATAILADSVFRALD